MSQSEAEVSEKIIDSDHFTEVDFKFFNPQADYMGDLVVVKISKLCWCPNNVSRRDVLGIVVEEARSMMSEPLFLVDYQGVEDGIEMYFTPYNQWSETTGEKSVDMFERAIELNDTKTFPIRDRFAVRYAQWEFIQRSQHEPVVDSGWQTSIGSFPMPVGGQVDPKSLNAIRSYQAQIGSQPPCSGWFFFSVIGSAIGVCLGEWIFPHLVHLFTNVFPGIK